MDQATTFETTESAKSAKSAHKDDQHRRDQLSRTLSEMNVGLSTASFERAYRRVRQAEDRSGIVTETQLRSIVDEVVTGTETLEGVTESFR